MKKQSRIMNVSLHPFDLTDQKMIVNKMITSGIKHFHIDIMDGIFVKNFALCQKNILDLKNEFKNIICESHMMISNPDEFVKEFANSNTDIYNFHFESVETAEKAISLAKRIKSLNMKVGMTLNINTSLAKVLNVLEYIDVLSLMTIKTGFPGQTMNADVLDKIAYASELRNKHSFNYSIEVDGGVREETYKAICKAGADILIVGHFLFDKDFEEQRRKIEEYEVE